MTRAYPKSSIPTLKPSSAQEPISFRARHTKQILQQSKNITLNTKIQAAKSHIKSIDTSKLTARHFIASQKEEVHLHPLTPMQASLTRKTWQATCLNPLTGRNLHNKEEPQTSSIQKGHPKHSNLNKMKRQRNIQQVKEHDKSPPNQTKEEEIGSLHEKEFRKMIVKLIQNLENKMELQINSLETRIEKMKENLTRT